MSFLFGGLGQPTTTQQQQPAGSSLFGNTTNTTSNTAPQQQQQQQPQQQQPLFASFSQPQINASQSTFHPAPNSTTQGGALNSLRDNQLHQSLSGSFSHGINGVIGGGGSNNALAASTTRDLAISRLQASNLSTKDPRTILDGMSTLTRKWDPQSSTTLLQTYLYNHVNPAYAPFYQPDPTREDPEKWEVALSKKPGDGYVPVLCRGFFELGQRVELQAKVVNEMRERLHEMNNSLSAVMRKHQLEVSVRIESAKRRHTQLAQQTLRLAVKTQVLRSRGFQFEAPEEKLRKQLQELEGCVFNPAFSGREEEIWARMVSLRERARWLDEEGRKVGERVQKEARRGVPDDVILQTKKILQDYDGQLAYLNKELSEVQKELQEWEQTR